MSNQKTIKYIHEGSYVAEVEVELIESDDPFTLNKNTFVLLSSEECSKFIAALDQPAQPSAALKELMALESLEEAPSPRKI